MNRRHDPQGMRLPIKLDSASNGEFILGPRSPVNRYANQLAHELAYTPALRRDGIDSLVRSLIAHDVPPKSDWPTGRIPIRIFGRSAPKPGATFGGSGACMAAWLND